MSFVAAAIAGPVVPPRATYRYYKGRSSSPPVQGSLTWKDWGYDDASGWGGNAEPFGYGYGYKGGYTQFTDPGSYITLYLRHVFNVTNPSSITNLTLAIDYDDGFAAYLNGTEIARRNLPAGALAHNTMALGQHEAANGRATNSPNEPEYIVIDPALLNAGSNVLAIEVHNTSLTNNDLFVSMALNEGLNLTRAPFLQLPEKEGVTVAWGADRAVTASVDWGADLSYSGGTVEVPEARLRQKAHLPIPSDGQKYYYRIRSGDQVLADGVALHAPKRADQSWRAVVYGDFGGVATPTAQLGAGLHVLQPDLQLTVGDNIYDDGQPGGYDAFWFTPMADVMRYAPLAPLVGNHDVVTLDGHWFREYFTLPQNGPSSPAGMKEKNYSFDYANAHFTMFDTEPFSKGQTTEMNAIRDWLQADLAATDKKWKIVFLHRPPYTSEGDHAPQAQVRDMLLPIIEAAGVQFIFQGHNHWYERIQPIKGVRYFTTGGGSFSRHNLKNRKIYSAALVNDRDSFGVFDVDGDKFHFKAIDFGGRVIDEFYLNLKDPFKMDGALDQDAPLRAENGLRLHAAIKGNHLYVATRDASSGNDHFLYVSKGPGSMKAANWGKTGQIAAWDAFIADESDNGYARWFDADGAEIQDVADYQVVTPGLANNDAANNGALEGMVDMRALWGGIPAKICLAAAAYGNANGGALLAQVPAGSSGNIAASNYLELDARSITLDLPVAVVSEPQPSAVESGKFVTLDGTASQNPSGLPLSYSWRQVSGPRCLIDDPAASAPKVRSMVSVKETGGAVFELVVNDTRFDSDPATIQILIDPLPEGSPKDSDGDGQTDEQEEAAGTDAFDASSAFRITSSSFSHGPGNEGDGEVVITWSSIPGKNYIVRYSGDMRQPGWTNLLSPIQATNIMTSISDNQAGGAAQRFYQIVTEQ